jgi:hypothetical protein
MVVKVPREFVTRAEAVVENGVVNSGELRRVDPILTGSVAARDVLEIGRPRELTREVRKHDRRTQPVETVTVGRDHETRAAGAHLG